MATSAPTTFSYKQLRQFWLKAGGNKSWSYIMAAIAMAESHGNLDATHVDSNNSVDYGLWQINSRAHPQYNVSSLTSDPLYNAKAAVAIFNSSGPHAWSTYNNGDYKKYMPGGKNTPPAASWGIYTPADYAGTDQGVDYSGKGKIPALDQAYITDVGHTKIVETGNKEWNYVIYRLQSGPYKGHYVYVAENFKPAVHKGQVIQQGQPIGYAPNAYPFTETGFNRSATGWNAFGNLNGPQPSGKAMKAYIASLTGQGPGVSNASSGATGVTPGNATPSAILSGALGGLGSGIEALGYQMLFGLIGIALIVVGLALIAWSIMGKVGAPGVIGMAQQQMRINQSAQRLGESRRASMTRESQAQERIELQKGSRYVTSKKPS